MDLKKIIAELREQAHWLDAAIAALEAYAAQQPKRRGRPPKWLTKASEHTMPETG